MSGLRGILPNPLDDDRGYEEGRKVTWQDGLVALWVLLKYRFTE
jgi:hypothetical protein